MIAVVDESVLLKLIQLKVTAYLIHYAMLPGVERITCHNMSL